MMATSFFETTKLSKLLSEKTKEHDSSESNEVNQLICLRDDVLFVWCQEELCLYSQILQKHINETDNNSSQIQARNYFYYYIIKYLRSLVEIYRMFRN